MGNKWEFGDEFLRLSSEYRKAKKDGDNIAIQRVKPRLDELNEMMWFSLVNGFPELASYSTLVEALEQSCLKNGLPFPDLNDREGNFTGKEDWKESGRFLFGVGNRVRSIQIFPMEDRGYISVEVYKYQSSPKNNSTRVCYKGQTSSIEDAAIALSLWYVRECSIKELHNRFPWMSTKPFKLGEPRITFE